MVRRRFGDVVGVAHAGSELRSHGRSCMSEIGVGDGRSPYTCRLVVKTYPNLAQVLGTYTNNHSHLIGPINAKFMTLSQDTHIMIEEKLRAEIGSQQIVIFFLV